MPSVKSELTKYLNELWLGIDGKLKVASVTLQINSEADLERFVQLGVEGDRTLLRVLGYGFFDVEDHPTEVTVIGHRQFRPDYILKREQVATVVIDLKAPNQSLSDSRWMGQLRSYYREKNVPLGLLFNGLDARLFINTNNKQLQKYEEHFSEEPVFSADRNDPKRIIELFSYLAISSFENGAVSVAERLAKRRLKEIERDISNKQRQDELRNVVGEIKSSPSDDVLISIQSADERLRSFDPPPSIEELRSVWMRSTEELASSVPVSKSSSSERLGLNPTVRQKVAELCALRGWSEDWANQIKSLRYRLDGKKEKGFYPVARSVDVPRGLMIANVGGPIASNIIRQLDSLIESSSRGDNGVRDK